MVEIARFWVSRAASTRRVVATRFAGSSAGRVPFRLSGRDIRRDRQQRLHERDGGVGDHGSGIRRRWNSLPLPNRLDLREKLGLYENELAHWDAVSRRMFVPFHDGVISQFEGYGDLEELDWPHYRQKYGDIQRLDRILEAEDDDVNRYKASKQADALMLLYLMSSDEPRERLDRLGYRFSRTRSREMVDYYMARTSHGSTLSGVVHTWVLARANRAGPWSSSNRFWCPTLPISRAARRRRAFISRPWPAASISCSGASPEWRPAPIASSSRRSGRNHLA